MDRVYDAATTAVIGPLGARAESMDADTDHKLEDLRRLTGERLRRLSLGDGLRAFA